MNRPVDPGRRESTLTRQHKRAALGWVLFFLLTVGLGITVLLAYGASDYERNLFNRLLSGYLNQTVDPQLLLGSQPADQPLLMQVAADLARFARARRVKFKAPDGQIVWSDEASLIGHPEPSTPTFVAALEGRMTAHYAREAALSNEAEPPLARWLQAWTYELYVPITGGTDRVFGVVEIYQIPLVEARVLAVQLAAIWLILGVGFGSYLLLSNRLFLKTSKRMLALQAELEKEQRLAAIGKGVSAFVHDTRNLLSSVRFACASLACEDMPQTARKRFHEELNVGLNMSFNMLEELLAYVSGKPMPLRRQRCKVSTLIDQLVPVLLPMLEVAGHRLVLNIPAGLEVYCDSSKLTHVLINLVRNSTEAMHTPGEIKIEAKAIDDGVRITVSDTGSGIDDALLPELFEPFVSGPDTPRPGLGLAIVNDLIGQHGGEITAHNRAGGGAEFELTFPNQPAAS